MIISIYLNFTNNRYNVQQTRLPPGIDGRFKKKEMSAFFSEMERFFTSEDNIISERITFIQQSCSLNSKQLLKNKWFPSEYFTF